MKSQNVARQPAKVPSLVAPKAFVDGQRPITIRKILVPTDFSPASRKSLSYALRFAEGLNSEITLLHVLEPETPLALTGRGRSLSHGAKQRGQAADQHAASIPLVRGLRDRIHKSNRLTPDASSRGILAARASWKETRKSFLRAAGRTARDAGRLSGSTSKYDRAHRFASTYSDMSVRTYGDRGSSKARDAGNRISPDWPSASTYAGKIRREQSGARAKASWRSLHTGASESMEKNPTDSSR